MKILYLVPYAPSQIRTRSYNLLRVLLSRGHRITLVTLWSSPAERESLEEFRAQDAQVISARLRRVRTAWNCAQCSYSPVPLQAHYAWQPALYQNALAAILQANQIQARVSGPGHADQEPFDVIHIEHLRGARYGKYLREALDAAGSRTPIVWDSVDCISSLFEQAALHSRSPLNRMLARFELPRTRVYEARLVRLFDRVLVSAVNDRNAFIDLLNEFEPTASHYLQMTDKLRVLPQGVQLDYFAEQPVPRDSRTVVFTGKMSYHANVTSALFLVREIMPAVWDKFPDTRLEIVGQDPPRAITSLAAEHAGRVIVTGRVPDIRPFLAKATLAVAPIVYGAGVQNKVLESMAMGTPVVANARAASALAVRDEQELLIRDTPLDFAAGIVRLLRNRALRERLGRNGRAYVETSHDWKQIVIGLEDHYYAVCDAQPVIA